MVFTVRLLFLLNVTFLLLLIVGIFSAAPVTGAVFNPAISIGPSIIDILTNEGVSQYFTWYYVVGPFLGGIFAYLLNKLFEK